MDLIQRLKSFLDERNIGVTQFADECSIPRPTASQLLAGRNKKVSDEMIGKIHQVYPDLSIMWLMFGEGNMIENAAAGGVKKQTDSLPASGSFYRPAQSREDFGFDSQVGAGNSNFVDPGVQSHNSQTHTPPLSQSHQPLKTQQTFSFAEHLMPRTDPTASSERASGNSATLNNQSVEGERKVVNIVVFYSDNTFESFLPDDTLSFPLVK
ncbi:MAG: helix-turn-helix domain-containing protein [Duncaniella sp.]|nr:helix-turn-helix domain-containing protein [Duncaniella sp.]